MGGAATLSLHTPNPRQTATHARSLRRHSVSDHVPEGLPVEVRVDDEAWRGVYFSGTVVPYDPQRDGKKTRAQVCVKYDELLADDKSGPLIELVKACFLRPAPPFEETVQGFEPGDVVDALYKDGWWPGSVKGVSESGRCIVTFQNPPDELEFRLGELRVHWDWFDGTWFRPVSQSVAGSMFRVGRNVEVSANEEDKRDAWFPATILRTVDDGTLMVEYSNAAAMDNNDAEVHRKIIDFSCVRPRPPLLDCKKYDLLEKVDAFFDCGWWSGVITKVLEDGEFLVYFQQRKFAKELHHSKVRPHIEWKDGKWYTSSKEVQVLCSDDRMHEHCTAENSTASVITTSADGLGFVKDISFFDRVQRDMSAEESLASVGQLASQDSGSDASWRMRVRGKQRKFHAPKKVKESPFPSLKKLALSSQGSSERSEKDVGSNHIEEVTPFIIGLPAELESPASGKNSGGRDMRSRTKNASRPQLTNSDGLKTKDVKQICSGGVSQKRKRGRPRKVPIAPSVSGSDDLNMEGDLTDVIPALGWEDCSLPIIDLENEVPNIYEVDTSPPDPSSAIENDQTNTKPDESRDELSSGAMDEISDSFTDEPLSQWIKSLQSPSKQDLAGRSSTVSSQQVQKNSDTEADASESIVEHTESETPVADSADAGGIISLPLVKNTLLWGTIESMEIFRKMPQRPHFKPLEDVKESSREGLAIGCMVTFSTAVERASKLQLSDSEGVMNDILETLTDLESHGFDVIVTRNRVSILLALKHEQKKLELEVSELNSRILESKFEASDIGEEIHKIDQQIEELQAKRSEMASVQEKMQGKVACLVQQSKKTEDEMGVIASKFETVASSSTWEPVQEP